MKSNPFATRWVAPGRLPWFGDSSASVAELARQYMRATDRRAAIVGPHGSGKSTLLAHLIGELGYVCYRAEPNGLPPVESDPMGEAEHACREGRAGIVWLQLRRGCSPVGTLQAAHKHWRADRILALDGFEQLPWWSRLRVCMRARRTNMGILATMHRATCLMPTLIQTCVSQPTAHALVDYLLDEAEVPPGDRQGLIDSARIGSLLQTHHGNMREVLMELYDDFRVALPDRPEVHCAK